MSSDTILKEKGMEALAERLGIVNAERFITLVKRDTFDYTQWQRNLFKDVPLDEFLKDAKAYREQDNL